MILKNVQRRRLDRREAFTLLEVLVVVAILVVLASVSSIYVFRYLDDSKKNKAMLQAKNIQTAAKAFMLNSGDLPTPQLLINPGGGQKPYLEGGNEAIMTPWGGQYSLSQQQRGDSSEVAIVVSWADGDGNQMHFPSK